MAVSAVAEDQRHRARRVEQTGRDLQALGWIGEQYGVRMDTLRVLLGRLSPEPESLGIERRGKQLIPVPNAVPGVASERTARDTIARWERAGLATSHWLLRQHWVTPTKLGLRRAGLGDYDPWPLPYTRLRHVHTVGVVRLAIEAEQAAEWISERRLLKERRFDRWHLPDAALPAGPEPAQGPEPRWLVEVELVRKTRRRLWDEVLSKLPPGTQGVTYFTVPKLVEDLSKDIEAVCTAHGRRLAGRVLPLPAVDGVSYEGPGGAW